MTKGQLRIIFYFLPLFDSFTVLKEQLQLPLRVPCRLERYQPEAEWVNYDIPWHTIFPLRTVSIKCLIFPKDKLNMYLAEMKESNNYSFLSSALAASLLMFSQISLKGKGNRV